MGVGAGLSMYVVVVQKFTFAISSPDEFLLVSSLGLLFLFGSVRQIKLAIRRLLGARKYTASYCIVSYRIALAGGGRTKAIQYIQCILCMQGRTMCAEQRHCD